MKILFIITGGTIVSQDFGRGLQPSADKTFDFASVLNSIQDVQLEIDTCTLFLKDSTNIDPEDWILILKKILENETAYNAFLIAHGTDTMAYTACALAFALRKFTKPIVLTGSMVPASCRQSDAPANIENSVKFLAELCRRSQAGVYVSFAGKLMLGTRVKKINSKSANAFYSVPPYQDVGYIENSKAVIKNIPFIDSVSYPQLSTEAVLKNGFCKNIFAIKIFPGFKPEYFDFVVSQKPNAIIVESFGAGGLPHTLIPLVKKASKDSIVVIAAQCVEGVVDLESYEVGQAVLAAGGIGAADMTFEAAVTKLMQLLPVFEKDSVKKLFYHNFCDETVGK